MEIVIGKHAGFCFGVSNAVTKTEEALKDHSSIDCLGELVHNKKVVSELENQGLRTIEDITEAKNYAIIRAHGTTKEVYQFAKENRD